MSAVKSLNREKQIERKGLDQTQLYIDRTYQEHDYCHLTYNMASS
jgi:hypothetical protein